MIICMTASVLLLLQLLLVILIFEWGEREVFQYQCLETMQCTLDVSFIIMNLESLDLAFYCGDLYTDYS